MEDRQNGSDPLNKEPNLKASLSEQISQQSLAARHVQRIDILLATRPMNHEAILSSCQRKLSCVKYNVI